MGQVTTRQASLHVTDRSVAHPQGGVLDAGLQPRPFPDKTASLLPGLLAATRTELTPASDDELTTAWSTTHMINHLSTGRTVAPRRGVHHDPGKNHYLWRAVDQHGDVLDILVTSRRDAKAATRFFRKLLKGLEYVPRVLITDKLASYGVAHRRLTPGVEHRRSKYLNNRAELPSTDQAAGTRDETYSDHPVAPNGSCPPSAPYHPTSGPTVTDSPRPSTDTR
jgi:hypothetical protein